MDVWDIAFHNSLYMHVPVATDIKLQLYIYTEMCLPVDYIVVYCP